MNRLLTMCFALRRWHTNCAAVFAVVAVVFASPGALIATQLIASTDDGQLYDIDVITGAATNPRELISSFVVDGMSDIAWSRRTGLIGIYTPAVQDLLLFFPIDAQTGELGPVFADTLLDNSPSSLAIHPDTGVLYTSDRHTNLSSWDVDNQVVAFIGNTNHDLGELAFDIHNTLYAIDPTNEVLLTLDVLDAQVKSTVAISPTIWLPTGNNACCEVGGMAFHPVSSVLLVSNGDTLFEINSTTGEAIEIGPAGIDGMITGLAFVPEPSNLVLLSALFGSSFFLVRSRTA